MSLLINDAYAAATNGVQHSATSEPLGSMLLLGAFVLFFYFVLWRPQSKRAKEHRELVSNLSKGDEIVTSGGLVGRIERLTDDFVVLTVAESVEITLQRSAIATILPKGTLKSI